jgi:hypothetical protein
MHARGISEPVKLEGMLWKGLWFQMADSVTKQSCGEFFTSLEGRELKNVNLVVSEAHTGPLTTIE